MRQRLLQVQDTIPGLALVAALAVVAERAGHAVPVLGAPVAGIVLGTAIGAVVRAVEGSRSTTAPGVGIAATVVLQLSIVILGSGLSLRQVGSTGVSSLPVMIGTLGAALVGACVGGRLLHVTGPTRTLIGVGTGICGASAIAAVTAVIGAGEAEVAYAIATIFAFNVAAVLVFPALGHLLGLSQSAFGLWAGTAINDTSSVVAAAASYGLVAAKYGVVVKLVRTLMIIPVCIGLAATTQRARPTAGACTSRRRLPWRRMFPLFLLGFLTASALDTAGAVPRAWHSPLTQASAFMITMALTAIGLRTRPETFRAAGARPLVLGGVLWVTVAVVSLALQVATGTA